MSPTARLFCGIILLTVPSIVYGGYFLLTILSGTSKLPLTDFQKSMFRAGHAHAGVLVILSLIAEILADQANLPRGLIMFVRIGFPLAAILVSGGFFAGGSGRGAQSPNPLIVILYTGVGVLLLSLLVLGIGLVSS
jgi:hypothetical protein